MSDPAETAAIISTANATWALFWATAVLCFATFGAVVVALLLPWYERRQRLAEESNNRTRQVEAVRADLRRAIKTMYDVSKRMETNSTFQPEEPWQFVNHIDVHNQVMKHHLGQVLPDQTLPSFLATILQGLFETRDVIKRFPAPDDAIDPVAWDKTKATMTETIKRIADVEKKLKAAGMSKTAASTDEIAPA